MPIRSEMRGRYPKDWKAISLRVREEAGQRCEWCGVPNRTLITRTPDGWREHVHTGVCLGEACAATAIVLTVAHLDHRPENVERSNLVALCQRCHLRYDAKEHRRNAAETRARKRDARTGQLALQAVGGAS